MLTDFNTTAETLQEQTSPADDLSIKNERAKGTILHLFERDDSEEPEINYNFNLPIFVENYF
jgi:hypothetical protein